MVETLIFLHIRQSKIYRRLLYRLLKPRNGNGDVAAITTPFVTLGSLHHHLPERTDISLV